YIDPFAHGFTPMYKRVCSFLDCKRWDIFETCYITSKNIWILTFFKFDRAKCVFNLIIFAI
ncbi:hypothetical protein, partial [Barnesiella sp. CU968]|uniref:hypothetical protein n=1 Tax=Barnesiella sp. CU968 TaxID=2780099 RepID=UPI00195EE79A